MLNHTIAAGYPRALLDFAVSMGAEREVLLSRSAINPEHLSDQDNRIPVAKYIALIEAGVELCNQPALSLLFGETVKIQDMSIVGLIGMNWDSWESGQEQINRYAPLILDEGNDEPADAMEVVRDNCGVWLKSTSQLYIANPLLTEAAFARTICGTRALMASLTGTNKLQFPKAIRFTHPEPDYHSEYDRIFGVPVCFNSDMNAVLVDEAMLNMTLPAANPYLSKVLSSHAEELLKRLERSKTMRGRVEKLLMAFLHQGDANIALVAARLNVSRATLFRRLRAEGTTYELVVDELRRELAIDYLITKHASVKETAYLLGFSEPGAFSRAFKRWTGYSPSQLPRTYLREESPAAKND